MEAPTLHMSVTSLESPMTPVDAAVAPSAAGAAPASELSLKVPAGLAAASGSSVRCRILNFIVASLALIACLPFLLVIALLVRFTSSGPVLFRQVRIGQDRRHPGQVDQNWRRAVDYGGKPFTMLKFRTMYVEQKESTEVWARPGDPRVTPVGRFLRATRLDELPQLVNVIKGEMSIVGPRPEQPEIFQTLRDQIHGYPVRQRVLPGITGWAQINRGYDQDLADVQEKLALDLQYIHRRSAVEDLRIMARTMPVMIGRRGGM